MSGPLWQAVGLGPRVTLTDLTQGVTVGGAEGDGGGLVLVGDGAVGGAGVGPWVATGTWVWQAESVRRTARIDAAVGFEGEFTEASWMACADHGEKGTQLEGKGLPKTATLALGERLSAQAA